MKSIYTKITIIVSLCFIFLSFTGFQIEKEQAQKSEQKSDTLKPKELDPEGFNWLEGDWKYDDGKVNTYESWKQIDSNYYEGISHFVKKDTKDTSFSRKIKLFKIDSNWVYQTIFPNRKLPMRFNLVYLRNYKAIFMNTDSIFPQQITYEHTVNFDLQLIFEGLSQKSNEPKRFVFTFKKIKK